MSLLTVTGLAIIPKHIRAGSSGIRTQWIGLARKFSRDRSQRADHIHIRVCICITTGR